MKPETPETQARDAIRRYWIILAFLAGLWLRGLFG